MQAPPREPQTRSLDGIAGIVSQVMFVESFSPSTCYPSYSNFTQIIYGVLYAVSPELFATKDRGTGNGIVATANRIFGVMVKLIQSSH